MSFNVAIDGPAGAGKSTIAKQIAKKMEYIYVDTGAMYRAMALYLIRNKVDVNDQDAISRECENADITIEYRDGEQQVILNGENVNGFIRTQEVGMMASKSSPNPDVRRKLVSLQQMLAKKSDVIMDGRDIGTAVLPGANLKVYLTASVKVRAKRRFDELSAKNEPCLIEEIEAEIEQRDYQDMHRELSPLKQAEDAILVDSSDMTIEQVVDCICKLIEERK